MASRASSYSTGSFSYFDHTYGQAKKALIWEHAGVTYESVIIIKGAGKSKSQECYLNRVKPDGTKTPVSIPDGTVSDGKSRSYDSLVEHLLGSPETFFTAAFSCQNRKTLNDYAPGEVKTLMGDMLGLESLRELATQANERAKGFRARLEALRGRQARAGEIETEQAKLADTAKALENELATLVDRKTKVVAAKDRAEQRLLEARQNAANQAETVRRRETLTKQLEAVSERESVALEDLRSNTERRHADGERALKQAMEDQARTNQHLSTTKARIAQDEALLAERDTIEAATARVASLDAEIATAREELAGAEAVEAAHRKAQVSVDEATVALRGLDSEGKSMGAACEAAKARAKLTDDVPCRGTDLQDRCKLLSDAVKAKDSLPQQEADLQAKREERRVAHERVKAAQDAVPDLPDVAACRSRLSAVETEARRAEALAAKRDAIAAADARLADDRAYVVDMDANLSAIETRIAELRGALDHLQAEARTCRERLISQYAQEAAVIQTELDALPPTDTAGLAVAEATATEARAAVDEAEQSLIDTRGRLAILSGRREALAQELEALADDLAKIAAIEYEIAQWTLLAKALGNEGIIALSIDDAGPTLTTLANDILTECYGPRFTVALVTQEETKAGTLRETFDIIVYDAERDDSKSLNDVSGGERVWLNEALTRAIALYLAQQSGRQYECLFADEADGALDAEKKRQWAQMMRAALRLSGAGRLMFITHSAEVREVADATIDVAALAA